MFSEKERGFSHGCIQVQEPAMLAAWVLRSTPGWDLESVERAMHQGRNNVRVDLPSPIPVQIVYETAVVDENGDVHFVHDIYGNDAMLEGKLARGYPYQK
jgi:murein L,D-transpeptidase YcbB/YkuD